MNSLNDLLSLIEDIKEKITDNEYKTILEKMKEIKENPITKIYDKYYIYVVITSNDYHIILDSYFHTRDADEEMDDEFERFNDNISDYNKGILNLEPEDVVDIIRINSTENEIKNSISSKRMLYYYNKANENNGNSS